MATAWRRETLTGSLSLMSCSLPVRTAVRELSRKQPRPSVGAPPQTQCDWADRSVGHSSLASHATGPSHSSRQPPGLPSTGSYRPRASDSHPRPPSFAGGPAQAVTAHCVIAERHTIRLCLQILCLGNDCVQLLIRADFAV